MENHHVIIAVIRMLLSPKGILVIGTPEKASPADIQVLKAAESQLDSAIVQAHNVWKPFATFFFYKSRPLISNLATKSSK